MKTGHALNAALVLLLFGASAWAYPRLPERIPAHFDASGEVTRWAETSPGSWFAIPLVALGILLLNYLIAAYLPRRPELINLPEKQQFLALPPERQRPVVARMQSFLHGVSGLMIVFFAYVQWTTYRAALGEDPGNALLALLVMSALLTPVILIVWLPPIQRELRRQVELHREDQGEA